MKIFSLFFLTFLMVALLGVSLGFPYYGHQRVSSRSNDNNSEYGHTQAQNHGDGKGNRTGRPTGSTPSGSSGSPRSGTPPPTPTGSSTRLPQ